MRLCSLSTISPETFWKNPILATSCSAAVRLLSFLLSWEGVNNFLRASKDKYPTLILRRVRSPTSESLVSSSNQVLEPVKETAFRSSINCWLINLPFSES